MAQRAQLGAGWVPQLPGTPATPAQGALLYVKSDGVLYTKNVAGLEAAVWPTGTIIMWPTTTAPGGFLLCAGGTFQSTTYSALATLLGDTYGTHTGTTYYLPDFRGRSPLGVGTASPAVPGGTAHTLAQKGGEEAHAITISEMPSHNHGGGDHQHIIQIRQSSYTSHNHYGFGGIAEGSNPDQFGVNAYSNWSGAVIGSQGGNAGHNTMHPFLGINFAIKT